MKLYDWNHYDTWNELFDALCHDRGYVDNADLASEFCRRSGRGLERDYGAAEKKLRNWRRGKRVPLPRNFVILSHILDVEADPALTTRWYSLYRIARDRDLPSHHMDNSAFALIGAKARRGKRIIVIAGLVAAVTLAILAAHSSIATDEDMQAGLPTVAYNARAFLTIGAEKLLHGAVEDCEGEPAAWEDMLPLIPSSAVGTFSDGGLATKMMNDCGKEMRVRAIKFTATASGVEEVRVLGDYFKIEVVPASKAAR
ncbi:hypothetical protein [Oryzicola mucosus]|uniref:Uncharacterized protein n=1 Tax=Oryzicola mucosus TaxID=2767425 RepID=A0A8J6PQX1_9HYPH|nr:hypothetical protein [Oryzicola mucosus]MBD0417232.1 hypothetical protein [Oryzicola mucosus]